MLYEGSINFQRSEEVLKLLTIGVLKPVDWADLQLLGNQPHLETSTPLRIAAPLLGTALIRDSLAELPPDLPPPPPEATSSVR